MILLALILFAAVPSDINPLDYSSWSWMQQHPPPLDYPQVIKRDPKQVAAFRKLNACPSTHKYTGACKGWVIDHIIPLCWGGEDKPLNMQWQEVKASYIKDVFERQACAMKKGIQ